jgi:glycogen synthase
MLFGARFMKDSEPLLFEVAWEVCRQVGGIYTVLSTKAAITSQLWGDRYCLIGPYTTETSPTEFELLSPTPTLAPVLNKLHDRGMQIHFGRWLVSGAPKVILFDYLSHFDRLNEFRQAVWDELRIGAPPDDAETNEAMVFGGLVAEFLAEFVASQPPGRRIVAHFHEWMASVALSLIRKRNLPIATLFTTHATLLGRYISSSRNDFHEQLSSLNPDYESGTRGIYHRYCIERGAAHVAHVFTTVSKVTADEAECLLKRRPEVILPNGLRVEKFAALHEFQNLHRQYKETLHEFVRGHFFGSYSFDLNETIYIFTSGRYEYHNKGFDLFIEALWRLNHRLRNQPMQRSVVAFIITKAQTLRISADVLRAHFMLNELRDTCETVTRRAGERLFESTARGALPDPASLLTPEDLTRLKRMLFSRRDRRLPTVCTHDMAHDDSDPILKHLRHRQLFNRPEDPVKIVYHPEFITTTNPLFGLEYDQFVRGCHLGVFPSYYEPWGYTPAECTVMGIPSVCTDLSGFGRFVEQQVPDHDTHGLFVIKRRNRSDVDAIEQLTDIMFNIAQLDRRERISLRNRTEQTSELLDWSSLGRYYEHARSLALSRAYPEPGSPA